MKLLIFLLLISSYAHALQLRKVDFCSNQKNVESLLAADQFKVEGERPHPALLAAVSYIMQDFQIEGPLILHFTQYSGPKKVWSMELSKVKHIYFAKNAIDMLLGVELAKVAEEVCRSNWTGTKTYTISYTNTVMEQFLRHAASHESLLNTLKKKTGWVLRSTPEDRTYNEEQDFRTEELVTLVKQLMDVPAEVFEKMKLRKVVRWRIGAPLEIKTAKAIYYVKEQKIVFGDGALMDQKDDIYGEGTILHEMGHAYWSGIPSSLQEKFINISWMKKEKQSKEWEKKQSGSDGFITEYSMTSPEEDFAEHFSAYMHNPEFLKRRAMPKNNYFEDNVFTDVSYFSAVADNAKVRIDSPTPDTKDPYLENDIIFRHVTEAKVREDGSKITDITIQVDKAWDDLSGIAVTHQVFQHVKNPEYDVYVLLTPEIQPDKSWTLKGTLQTEPHKLAPGMYKASSFALNDKAGNRTYYETNRLPEIFIDGFLSTEKAPKDDLDVSQIKIEEAPVVSGYPGVVVTLPIIHKEELEYIHLTWEMVSIQQKTVHVCQTERSRKESYPCLLSKPGELLKMQGYFFKEYPNTTIKLASVLLSYKGSQIKSKATHDYIVPQNLANASHHLQTGTMNMVIHDLEVNQMKLRSVDMPNKEGGDQNIEVVIPLINREAGKYNITSTVRSPTGKSIMNITGEWNKKDGKITNVNGENFLTYTIPLKKNPEDGIYIIESLEAKTQFERPLDPYLPLDLNEASVKKIKLLERGIKRTFTISDDKVTNLN